MLVVPKSITPTVAQDRNYEAPVRYILPEEDQWYRYDNKTLEAEVGVWKDEVLGYLDHATWMKGGSILPILSQHDDCMAILSCIENAIRLEIYVDQEHNWASGLLYVDDGASYNYQNSDDQSAIIQFEYFQNHISSENTSHNGYKFSETQKVHQISIYGLTRRPYSLTTQDGTSLSFEVELQTASQWNIKVNLDTQLSIDSLSIDINY
jgi:alpha-glucosidase (family GH31 glycosyl hydrolase)